MKSLRFLPFVAVLAMSLVTSAPAGANHSWENFHWSRTANPFTLPVMDSVVGEWDSYLPLVNSDWAKSSVLDLAPEAGPDSIIDRTACLAINGKVRACNAKYADVTWLGLATVWLSGDHITSGTAQVNDTWFDTEFYNDPNAKRHVLCQEIGHVFGLDHTYGEPTCMDDGAKNADTLFDPAFVSPGPHDYQQLDTIYAHLDGTGGGGGGNGGCKGGPKKCGGNGANGGGNGANGGGNGRGAHTFHVVYDDGFNRIIQYIWWA